MRGSSGVLGIFLFFLKSGCWLYEYVYFVRLIEPTYDLGIFLYIWYTNIHSTLMFT